MVQTERDPPSKHNLHGRWIHTHDDHEHEHEHEHEHVASHHVNSIPM